MHSKYWPLLLSVLLTPLTADASSDGVSEIYRLTLAVNHPIEGNLTGGFSLDYFNNPNRDYQRYQITWPQATYAVMPWLQLSGGLLSRFTDNEGTADLLELRPYSGVKLFVPNPWQWNIYSYTRYEYRAFKNLDTGDWSDRNRLRSQFGIEVPLASQQRAWKPKTWYALASAEPFYRFDTGEIDPVRLSAGIGRVLNDRLRIEFLYYAELSRSSGGGLRYSDNIFQLNFRLGLKQGLLRRLLEPTSKE
jgi:Protein of unknown function (DUF2490)